MLMFQLVESQMVLKILLIFSLQMTPELFQEVSAEDTIMSDHDLVTIDLGYNFSS